MKTEEICGPTKLGAFDGANLCEVFELCILNTINTNLDSESIGLYINDRFAMLKSASGSRTYKKAFYDYNLSISSMYLYILYILNIAPNLCTESYRLYRKPNNQPLYILRHSNLHATS